MNTEELNQFIIQFDQISLFRQRNKILRKPNFIGVGAGRCGTTSIYQYLNDHPDVYMSPVKEINYFGIRNLERNQYGLSFREYLYYFLAAENQKCVGEISPAYLTTPGTASLIKEKLGEVKILITLRDPIDRAISQYKHHLEKHKIADINEYFEKGLQVILNQKQENFQYNWFHPAKNIMQSVYSEGVKLYINQFGKDNVFIVTYDQIKKDDGFYVLERLCHFLELEHMKIELSKANSSSHSCSQDVQFNKISKNTQTELLDLFSQDLIKLDSLTGLNTKQWVEKY